jgi:hypothetical protein
MKTVTNPELRFPGKSRCPLRGVHALIWVIVPLCLLAGCGDKSVEQALDSDANGYVCTKCSTRFYTKRDVFPNVCPGCKQPDIEQVMGYVCTADNVTLLGPRSRGAMRCSKCGKATTAVSIPKEAELKSWGATRRTGAEVGAP